MAASNQLLAAKNEATAGLRVAFFGKAAFAYVGDLDGESITMEASHDSTNGVDGTWGPCYPGSDGTVQESWTNSAFSVRPQFLILPGGMWIRWKISNGAGTPVDVRVLFDGENLSKT